MTNFEFVLLGNLLLVLFQAGLLIIFQVKRIRRMEQWRKDLEAKERQ